MGKKLLKVLGGEKITPPPLWIMRQAGRYLPEYRLLRSQQEDFIKFCLSPSMASEATLQPFDRFDFDAAIIFADILLVPLALGRDVSFVKGKGPVLDPLTVSDISSLKFSSVQERLGAVGETVHLVRKTLPEDKAVIGFAGAPWTVATYMIEGGTSRDRRHAREMAWRHPEAMAYLLEVLVEATADYLLMQVEAGADVLKIFDSWATGLPEPLFKSCVLEPTKKLVHRLRSSGVKLPVIGFPRGAGFLYKSYVRETGVDAVALDTSVPCDWAAHHLQNYKPVQGNLDPLALIAGGKLLEREVKRIKQAFSSGPHIFNLGHGILPETPPEHVSELVRMVKENV